MNPSAFELAAVCMEDICRVICAGSIIEHNELHGATVGLPGLEREYFKPGLMLEEEKRSDLGQLIPAEEWIRGRPAGRQPRCEPAL